MGEPRWRGAGAPSLVGWLGWHQGTVGHRGDSAWGGFGVVSGWQDLTNGHGVLCTNVLAQPAARQRGMRRGKARREVAPGAPQLAALARLLTRSFPAHPPFFFFKDLILLHP